MHPSRLRRLGAFLASAALTACGPVPTESRPDLLLITVDTLRADHLSSYGYSRETSPFLDALAARGALFTSCRSTSSWTAPSMASLFTGLGPHRHGVRSGWGSRGSQEVGGQQRLLGDFETLAEGLRAVGYETLGISSNLHVSPETGMAQGFDTFVSLGFADAPAVHRAALALRDRLSGDAPWFLWVHYLDPHAPYEPRSPYVERFAGPDARAEWAALVESGHSKQSVAERLRRDPELLRAALAHYDAEIRFTDEHIRALFEEVLGEADPWVVVTSDHGEGFVERGSLGHGRTLYDEEIRVPCIVAPPRGESYAARVVDEPVSGVDVLPTLLELGGAQALETLDGRSLVPALRGAALEQREIVSRLDRSADFSWISSLSGAMKRLRVASKRADAPLFAFYDLSADPGERRNLYEEDEGGGIHAERLSVLHLQPPFQAPEVEAELGPHEVEALRALGYLE